MNAWAWPSVQSYFYGCNSHTTKFCFFKSLGGFAVPGCPAPFLNDEVPSIFPKTYKVELKICNFVKSRSQASLKAMKIKTKKLQGWGKPSGKPQTGLQAHEGIIMWTWDLEASLEAGLGAWAQESETSQKRKSPIFCRKKIRNSKPAIWGFLA